MEITVRLHYRFAAKVPCFGKLKTKKHAARKIKFATMDFTVFGLEKKKGIFMCVFTMQTYSFLKLCRHKEPRRFGIKRGNF